MAKVKPVYQTKRDEKNSKRMVKVIDQNTGKPIHTGGWCTRIITHTGKRKFITLAYRGTNRKSAQFEADLLEAREREITKGLRAPPTPASDMEHHSFKDTAAKYIAGGKQNGGRRRHPWSDKHAKDVTSILGWWGTFLELEVMTDTVGCLPKVEAILRNIEETGRPKTRPNQKTGRITGKTLQNILSVLNSFFGWCAVPTRGYLSSNPLAGITWFNTGREKVWRSLTSGEIQSILSVATLAQRTLLETGLLTGLRLGELRGLTEDHFDPLKKLLHIGADKDKGRKERSQVVPDGLAKKLEAFVKSGEAKRLYAKFYSRKDCTAEIPERPLLFTPSHASRMLKELAKKAGIPIETKEGMIVFHGSRTTYIDHLVQRADTKTVQALARHEDPKTTLNIYARVHDERLRMAANDLEKAIIAKENWQFRGRSEKYGGGNKIATTDVINGCEVTNVVEAAGIEPASCDKSGGSRSVRSR